MDMKSLYREEVKMQDWTKDEWDNLQRQTERLSHLLDTRPTDGQNRAWQLKVRLAIEVISAYQETR